MSKILPILDEPLNAGERMLHGIAMRLERIIDLLENIIEEKEEVKIEVKEEVKEVVLPKVEESKVPKAKKKKD